MEIYVGAIIQDRRKKLLLQKRDQNTSIYPNCWTIFGGKVEPNETPESAILRELSEEISLKRKDIICIQKIMVNKIDSNTKQIIFFIKTKIKLTELILEEGEKMEFVSQNDLFKRKFAFNIKEVLEEFLQSYN